MKQGSSQHFSMRITLIIFCTWFTPVMLNAQDSIRVEQLGEYSLSWYAIADAAAKDSMLYITTGNLRIQVISIANPDDPEYLNDIPISTWFDLVILDDYLVCHNHDSLLVYSLHDPTTPQFINGYDTTGSRYIPLSRNHLFIDNTLYNLENGELTVVWEVPEGMAIVAAFDTVGIIANNYTAQIVSFAIPDRPVVASTLPVDSEVSVAAMNSNTLILDQDYYIELWDISSISDPIYRSSIDIHNGTRLIGLNENTLFLKENGVRTIDITELEAPVELQTMQIRGYNLHLSGSLLLEWNATWTQCNLYDFSDAANPSLIAEISREYEMVTGVIFDNQRLFVQHYGGALTILDASNPNAIVELSHTDSSDFTIIGSWENGILRYDSDQVLHVLEIDDEGQLTELSNLQLDFSIWEYEGNITYQDQLVALAGSGFALVSLEEPTAPEILFSENDAQVSDCLFKHGYLYRIKQGQRRRYLEILDYSDPEHPEIIGSCGLPVHDGNDSHYTCHKLVVAENYAFVDYTDEIWGFSSLISVYIGDPENPVVYGSAPGMGSRWDMEYAAGVVFSAYGDIDLIDVRGPGSPQLLQAIESTSWITSLELDQEYLYSTDESTLRVYEIFNELDAPKAENETVLPSKIEITRVYPNPFNSTLNVEYRIPESQPAKIRIYSLDGRIVKEAKISDSKPGQLTGAGENNPAINRSAKISFEGASGVYFISLEGENLQHDIRKVIHLK